MNVLIIDDDIIDRMAIQRTLQTSELPIHKVDEAISSTEGIIKAQAERYDMILLDYQLPPSNGIEVLRELRGSNNFSTAIVMLSHSNDEELALKCIEAGAQDFVMKSEVTATRLKRAVLISAERHHLEQQVKQSHDQLRRLAEEDTLTGLSNRYFFDEAIKDAIPRARRANTPLALLFLDLDNFKGINDTYGHLAGDLYLKEVACRLREPVRDGDKLCRLGGDEFAILAHKLNEPHQIRLLVQRIFDSLAKPVDVNGIQVDISVSIGVATYPECGQDAVELMKSADVAMYRSKGAGRNQVHYYSKEFHEQVETRVMLEHDLRRAIDNQEFSLVYQPQLDAKSQQFVGVEALIRWNHPSRGLISPDDFIPIAEEAGFINEIGRWVLDAACKQFSAWLNYGASNNMVFSIAANLSAKQLLDTGLVEHLQECMSRYRIPAEQLELELTESSLEKSLVALDMLKQLSDIGVQLALDDFGTGYSSLSHLKDFPFTILKIDKSFVQNIETEDEALLLKAISSFAQSLNYQTVAEGVETELQKQICIDLGVNRLQGYLFSKPLSPQEIEDKWLSNR